MKYASALVGFGLFVVSAVGAVGCGNPVQDAKIDALPPEVVGVPEGEFHRPGQPCLLCHSDYGGDPTFSVAGTIFAFDAKEATDEPVPVEGAVVTIYDTTGVPHTKATNCVGNFYFTADEWQPIFPLAVVVDADKPTKPASHAHVTMDSRVNREGSCAGCHFLQRSQVSPGWVYLTSDHTIPFKVRPTCQGAPNFP
jgi:hypothetical protein